MSKKRAAAKKKGVARPRQRAIVVGRQISPLADPRVAAWDRLLRDPCSSDLAYPCYAGADSGYLARTTDFYTPVITGLSNLTSGTTYTADWCLQYIPHNLSGTTGLTVSSHYPPGATAVASGTGFASNFVLSSAVKRFRPIAACVKWIPSGPYSVRQGVVSMGYSPGGIIFGGESFNAASVRAEAQIYATNGSMQHEVRWLPTAIDENFTQVGSTNNGAGAVFLALTGVDTVATSATAMAFNGSFEVTTVWEWIPDKLSGNLTVSPKAPLPYTSQQVLSTINDMGAYLFQGMREVAKRPGVVQGATNAALGVLTRGIMTTGTRPAGMLTF